MKYITSSNLAELEAINTKIHQHMKDTVTDYNATEWSFIFKHPTEALYMLPVNDTDFRNPVDALDISEKTKFSDKIDDTWKEAKNGTLSFKKHLP